MSDAETESDNVHLALPIQTGVRQRHNRPIISRQRGREGRAQQKHVIGGDVVRSMKKGLSTRRNEERTRFLFYFAVVMFGILSIYWVYRIDRRLGLFRAVISYTSK